MKFSEAFTEYLQLREDEKSADYESEPMSRGASRRERMDELLMEMDRITLGVEGTATAQDQAIYKGMADRYQRERTDGVATPVVIEVGKSYTTRNGATVKIVESGVGCFYGDFGPGNQRRRYAPDGRYCGDGAKPVAPWDITDGVAEARKPYGWARTSGPGPESAPLFLLGESPGRWADFAAYIPLYTDGVPASRPTREPGFLEGYTLGHGVDREEDPERRTAGVPTVHGGQQE